MSEMKKKLIKAKELQERCSEWVDSQVIYSTEDEHLSLLNLDETDDTISNSEFDSVSQCGAKRRRLAVKLKDEILDMECDWKDCSFKSSSPKLFLEHVGEHIPELEMRSLDDGTTIYLCGWKNCPYETNLATSITWHVYYHAYHQKLKSIGNNFKQRNKLTVTNFLIC